LENGEATLAVIGARSIPAEYEERPARGKRRSYEIIRKRQRKTEGRRKKSRNQLADPMTRLGRKGGIQRSYMEGRCSRPYGKDYLEPGEREAAHAFPSPMVGRRQNLVSKRRAGSRGRQRIFST